MLIEIQRRADFQAELNEYTTESILVNTDFVTTVRRVTLDGRRVLEVTLSDKPAVIICPVDQYDVLFPPNRGAVNGGEVWETMYRCLMSMAAAIKKANLKNGGG